MRPFLLAVVLSAICTVRVLAAGVAVGMERSDVERALGKPSAVLQRDDRQVLVYPNNGRVELANGRVVEMTNVAISDEVFESIPGPDLPAASPKPASVDEEDADEKPSDAHTTPRSAKQSPVTHEAESEEDHEAEMPESTPVFLLGLLIVGVIRTAITIVVLKLAFKWADVHADWSQMIAPAVSDTVVRTVIVIVASKAFGTTDLFYADEALAYFALIFVLMRTTHACTLTRALTVAGAAKLAGIVVGSMLAVLVLAMLAG